MWGAQINTESVSVLTELYSLQKIFTYFILLKTHWSINLILSEFWLQLWYNNN